MLYKFYRITCEKLSLFVNLQYAFIQFSYF